MKTLPGHFEKASPQDGDQCLAGLSPVALEIFGNDLGIQRHILEDQASAATMGRAVLPNQSKNSGNSCNQLLRPGSRNNRNDDQQTAPQKHLFQWQKRPGRQGFDSIAIYRSVTLSRRSVSGSNRVCNAHLTGQMASPPVRVSRPARQNSRTSASQNHRLRESSDFSRRIRSF